MAGIGCLGLALLLTGCSTNLNAPEKKNSHLNASEVAAPPSDIPSIVKPVPVVPPPVSDNNQQLYTVVAQDIPIRDLLFKLARDTAINVDVDPAVTGTITLNAIDQSLPQILERLSHQANIRWHFDEAGNLVIAPDDPYWVNYTIDYVNVQRKATTTTAISTSVASGVANGGTGGGTAGGANNSSSSLTQSSDNNFWATLSSNLATLIGETSGGANSAATTSQNIVANPEGGVLSVKATSRQHAQIRAFINTVTARSLYQVLIEATVVQVALNDNYQGGVDWSTLARNSGIVSFVQNTGSTIPAGTNPLNTLTIDRSSKATDAIKATISMLSVFGESRVLSSPKIMALNNQPAMLRVVDNKVYFTIDVTQSTASGSNGSTVIIPTYTSTPHTMPVGLVMAVTPQVSADDQVTLNVRPTISRILGYVNDPNPILANNKIANLVPETSVNEFESVLKVESGQIAILGGLMEDTAQNDVSGLPVVSRLPGIRNLFSNRTENSKKTEIIIFIRPVVVKNPSVNGDLKDYQQYLPTKSLEDESSAINTSLVPSMSKGKSE